MKKQVRPGYREAYNVNPNLVAFNSTDEDGNPTGGEVVLPVSVDDPNTLLMSIQWQNGPRGQADGSLANPNGAFVEDVIWAALQRLEYFNDSKYRDRANSLAITHLEQALQALKNRQLERSYRGVEGKHQI